MFDSKKPQGYLWRLVTMFDEDPKVSLTLALIFVVALVTLILVIPAGPAQ